MGREVRRVPKDWQHPTKKRYNSLTGREEEIYQPMFDEPFGPAMEAWYAGWKAWESGEDPDRKDHDMPYWEWDGGPPDPEYYRPDWPEETRTHLMMYEDTSEGTPISPAFETPEELARWLADNGASAFADHTATYEQWLATCRGSWAPSAVIENGVMRSGVEFAADALRRGVGE
jgi:hypothetical protein